MPEAPYALALAAGVLAAVNPCGFALLPAYVSLLVIDEQVPQRRMLPVLRALSLTGAMTAGFVTVFGSFGLLAAPAADWLAERLPWLTVVIGLVLVALGGWLLAGGELTSPVPKAGRGPHLRRRFWPMYLFGMSFAVASLGCTIGPFLGVVVIGFSAGSTLAGVGLFLSYAAGMALVVGTVAVAVALARQSVVKVMRRAAPMLARAAGLLMVLAGAYVAWYGWYEIRIFADPDATDPVIDTAAAVQTALAALVDAAGAGVLAAVLAALVVLAGVVAFARRSGR